MKRVLLVLFLLSTVGSYAQNAVGHTTITFNDPTRNGGFGSGGGAGRQIQTEIYYPANTAGDDVPVAGGSYPVVVFGHGFVMVWDAYQNIWEALVAQGYIVALPRTEGGLAPSHADFGADIRLIVDQMQVRSTNPSFFFFNKVGQTSAVMGHSMGGGAAHLAAENNSQITCIATLAAAETNTSAIAAAANIRVPYLAVAGGNDCVTPPANHQILMYNNAVSKCKSLVTVTGGSHCQFSNDNFNCNFGEATCSPSPTITRAQQHATVEAFLIPFLNKYLKGTCATNSNYDGALAATPGITFTQTCEPQAGNDVAICGASPVQLGSTIMGGYTFGWTSNPSGYTNATATPTVTPSATTDYILTYTNNFSNCVVVDTKRVTVNPVPTVSAGADNTICTNNTAQLGSTGVTGTTYTWLPATGLNSATASNPTFTPTGVGNNTFIVTANLNGCTKADTVAVQVIAPPTLTVTPATASACPGAPIAITVSSNAFVPTTYAAPAGAVAIPDNTPAATGNTLPTLAQLAGRANKQVTIPAGTYIWQGINLTINHPFNGDMDIYLATPNNTILLISTDNGGTGDNYLNVTFNDAAAGVPPTGNTNFANVSYRPEGVAFNTYTGPIAGTWTLYAVDDASQDAGSINDFKVLVTELPSSVTYSWLPATGLSNANVANPTSTAITSQNYTPTLTYLGCTAQGSSVATTRFALPTANAGTNTAICNGANPVTIGTPAVGGLGYSWTSIPAGFTAAIAQPSVNPTQTTDYIVTVTDANTCQNQDTVRINVGLNPTPVITSTNNSNSICQGQSLTLQAGNFSSYVWNPGNVTTPQLTVTQAGSYTVTVTDPAGCQGTSGTFAVTNAFSPFVSFSIVGNSAAICAGDSLPLQMGTLTPVTNIIWTPNAPDTNIIWITDGGTYSATFIDPFSGCTFSTDTLVVSENPLPIPNITPVNAIVCEGDSVVLTADAGFVMYSWTPFTGNSQTLVATQTGLYSVIVTDANGCQGESSPSAITVNPLPQTPVITQNGTTLEVYSGAGSYQWFLDGQPITGATQNTFTPEEDGNYTVVVTNFADCEATSAPYSFIKGSVSSLSALGFKVYPSPTTGNAVIFNPTNQAISVAVYNALGALVYKTESTTANTTLPLATQAAGVYNVVITTPTQRLSGKVVKE